MRAARLKVIALALAVASSAASLAQANPVTYTVDFANPAEFATLAYPFGIPAGYAIAVDGNGDLVLSGDGTGSGPPLGILAPLILDVDFDARLTMTFASGVFPQGAAGTGTFGANSVTPYNPGIPGNSGYFHFGKGGGQPAGSYRMAARGDNEAPSFLPTSNATQTFQFVRSGNTLSQYYDAGGGNFTLLHTFTSANPLGPIQFGAALGLTPAGVPATLTLSDFSVTYDDGLSVPVPAPGALAVLGLGLLGFGALRRKKLAA